MPRLYVSLDTNVYVQLSTATLAEIRELEHQQDVQALASFFTVLELVSHLRDPSDPDFQPSRSALSRLWTHCSEIVETRPLLRFAVDSEAQLCLTLFDRVPPGRDQQAAVYSELVRQITESAAVPLPKYEKALQYLYRHSQKVKTDFVSDLRRGIAAFDPTATGWQPFANDAPARKKLLARLRAGEGRELAAGAVAAKHARMVGAQLSAALLEQHRQTVLHIWGTAIYYYDRLIQKIIESGFDISKGSRSNAIWDFHIAFLAARGALIKGNPFRLISNDSAIREAAQDAGVPETVLSVPAYLEMLKGTSGIAGL